MATLRKKQRQAQILSQATRMARDGKLYVVTAEEVAEEVGCSRPTIMHYFKSMQGLRDAVVKAAITDDNLNIIAQAIAANDPLMEKINESLRQRAVLTLAR